MSIDWKPISTAPRDGSWIMVNSVTLKTGRCFVYTVQWSAANNDFISDDDVPVHSVTHWDELPIPPDIKEIL